MKDNLLNQIVNNQFGDKSFALLYRPQMNGPDKLQILLGNIDYPKTLKSVSLSHQQSTLIVIPYRQLNEKNFQCIDDKASLIAISIKEQQTISIDDALTILPNEQIELCNSGFISDDNTYANIVRQIIKDEIGYGEGANFVIKRSFSADISHFTLQSALSVFARLLKKEIGSYWTFIIHAGDITLVGASPEMHVSLKDNIAMMNPISGTYRYPFSGPTLEGMMHFLSISKEKNELYMVLEEEIKMMSRFCPTGVKVVGPFLKEMSRLAHTEYYIQGKTQCNPIEILYQTMFAPTVTGSPLENACHVIKKYEQVGRRYYSGVAALIENDVQGNYILDSTILIRSAEISAQGHLEIGVGATIVRDSNPYNEVDETWGKINALLDAMTYKETNYV